MKPWLSILSDGKFETHLTTLVLLGKSEERHEGSGQIVWNSTDGIRLRAITTSETTFFDIGSPYEIGKLLPLDAYLLLEGDTADSCEVICERIFEGYDSIHLGACSGMRTWDTSIDCLHLYQQAPNKRSPGLMGYLKPSHELTFSQHSRIIDDNPVFGGTSNPRDWITFSTTFATYSLRKDRKNKEGMVQISVVGDMTLEGMEEALESLRLAVSFIEGKSVEIVGFEALCKGFVHMKVFDTYRKRESSFSQPLPSKTSSSGQHDILLQQATEFFHTKRGREYSDSLRMCWDCVDNYGSIKAVATCAALENLIRLVVEDSGRAEPTEEERRAADREEKEEAQRLKALSEDLENGKERYGKRLVKRVLGILGSSHHKQPKKILYDWVNRGFLGIEEQDILAWDKLRNPVSHGHLVFNDHDVEILQVGHGQQMRVEKMINKIILNAIGSRGC